MIYFINNDFNYSKSGIEHAQLKRMYLFRHHGEPFQLITLQWNSQLHNILAAEGVTAAERINLFDYYQHATDLAVRPCTLADLTLGLPQPINYTVEATTGATVAHYPSGNLCARIYARPDHQLERIERFDDYGNLYTVDYYDVRGFKSMTQWYTPDNKIGRQAWYTPAGQVVLQNWYHADYHGQMQPTYWLLTDHDGAVYRFNHFDKLAGHFINQLNNQGHTPNIFVMDRSEHIDDALLHLDKPAYTIMHIHSSHTTDSQNPNDAIVNNNFEFGLVNIGAFNGVISATVKQAHDIAMRYPQVKHSYAIPVGVVSDELLAQPQRPINERTANKVVVLARIAPEKRLDHMIRAVAIAHQQVPDVTLDIYGYVNDAQLDANLHALVQELGLAEVVTFKGYTEDTGAVLDDAVAFGVTSEMEGFNLAVMEAISHGVIGLTYDVNYGPNEIVQDEINGYVVPYNDYPALGERLTTLLQDAALQQALSTGAYYSAQRYNEAHVWQAWQQLINDAHAMMEAH